MSHHYQHYASLHNSMLIVEEEVSQIVKACVKRICPDRELLSCRADCVNGGGLLTIYLDGLILEDTQLRLENNLRQATGFALISMKV